MFSPPKHRIAILAAVAAAFLVADLSSVLAQTNKRTNTLRQARTRALPKTEVADSPQPVVETTETVFAPPSARPLVEPPVYQGTTTVRQARTIRPPANTKRPPTGPRRTVDPRRNVNSTRGVNSRRIQPMQASRVPSSYVPQHLRLTQYVSQESVVEDQAPIMSQEEMFIGDEVYMDSDCGNCGECLDCCGSSGGYFDACDPCFDRGGCDPCVLQNCWLRHLGPLFRNSEWNFGAVGFNSPRYDMFLEYKTNTGEDEQRNIVIDDSSYGFNFDFNSGIPLCHLTCGLLSAQFGARWVHSNFDGKPISKDGRKQVFVTTGLYRRVDYGLQVGVVTDFLQDEWYVTTKVNQVRGDIAWVYPSGKMFGFKFATGTRSDGTEKSWQHVPYHKPGAPVIDITYTNNARTLEYYRFYYQYLAPCGGTAEYFAGWSEQNQAIFGADWDVPLKDFVAIKTGFTYFGPGRDTVDIDIGGDGHDSWNVYTGCVYRPRGRSWYRCYDKPLFNVADNGTMVQLRDIDVIAAEEFPF